MEKIEENFLSIEDYIVMAITMIISAGIGLYFRFSGGQQKTKDEYLMAGKNMSILPVAFSLMATFFSTATLMGIPTDMYIYGTNMAFMNVGVLTGVTAASYVFIPVYFSAQVSTSYEYIEKRFGPVARSLCSLVFLANAALYMAVVLYTPALALSAVSNLSTWTSVISIGVVCTFYVTIGGMKAVLWTDMFQATLMFTCLITIITKGSLDMGGIGNVFRIANDGGRLVVPSFSFDFSLRYTMWNILFQGFCMCFSTYGTSQLQVQRMLSVKNSARARKALFASLPITVAFHGLCSLSGIIIYAAFHDCDPLSMPINPLKADDQVLPYFIMTRLRDLPGLPGLCICGIFAASLSTVSSYIQTLTVVTIEDFLRPFCYKFNYKVYKSTFCAKALTFFYGLLGIVLAVIISGMGNVVDMTVKLFGLLGGPLLGIFLLAVLTVKSNETGAVLGILCSFTLVLWLTFGPVSQTTQGKLPLSIENCPLIPSSAPIASTTPFAYLMSSVNTSDVLGSTNSTETPKIDHTSVSHMWITPIGVISCVLLGYIFSCLNNCFTGYEKEIEPEYLSPVRLWWSNIFKNSNESAKNKEVCELKEAVALNSSNCVK